jgi:hypothetical protein
MGSKSSPPSATDPNVAAQAQIGVNQATIDQLQRANNSNQVNPFGSQTWSKDPTSGQWTQSTQYSPQIQQQLEQQVVNTDLGLGTQGNAQQRLANENYLGSSLDLSGLPQGATASALPGNPLVTGIDRSSTPALQTGLSGAADPAALKQAQDATYNQMTSRLDPQWNNAQEQYQSQLVDQGIPQNSEAWNRAMDDFTRQRTDAYQSANNAAVSSGNDLQQQLFGQGATAGQFANTAQNQAFQQLLSSAGFTNSALGQNFAQADTAAQFQNQARAQSLSDLLMQRNQPLNEVNAVKSGAPMTPQFGQTNQVAGPAGAPNMGSLYGQQYQAGLDQYNAQAGQTNSTIGAVGTIGTIAAMLL